MTTFTIELNETDLDVALNAIAYVKFRKAGGDPKKYENSMAFADYRATLRNIVNGTDPKNG